ncbi:MAG: metallophosphatase family protein [Proteobacteria bacterium]|nr:metallophosphatase family protein [Pseudomonadota bacterium]MBU4036810.1 metallophosphatase family protein [Pseudomonadota bacterium]
MRLAVISDIHGNTEAFGAVLADIEISGVDAMVCLGDVIGYGPEPNETISMVCANNIPTVMGNHELGIINREYLSRFNPAAYRSMLITIDMLNDESMHFVNKLETSLVSYSSRFVHGFPPESPTIYMIELDTKGIQDAYAKYEERICFIGHTHSLRIIESDGNSIEHGILQRGKTELCADNRYIINAGSVGQPRDGDNHAKYIIWDTSNDSIEAKYISYDIDSVVNKIMKAGFPEINARRLL